MIMADFMFTKCQTLIQELYKQHSPLMPTTPLQHPYEMDITLIIPNFIDEETEEQKQ